MKKPVDCVFVTVPYTDTIKPLMAPAILKSIATQAGKTSVTIDLNRVFLNQFKTLPQNVQTKMIYFLKQEIWYNDQFVELVFDMFQQLAQKILAYSPKVVGISVFTYDCRVAAKYIAWMIKKIDPSVKIIFGGAGIMYGLNQKAVFAETLQKSGLIDFFIYGDGEKSLYHYLTTSNEKFVGINRHAWLQLTNKEIEALPRPDYSDYDFSMYPSPEYYLPILGSRGCVRHCTFCDVHGHWEKFTYRSGQHIFEEMKYFKQEFGVKYFQFTDSLINGNLREYRVMTQLLSDHNKDLPEEEKITWGGFFIFRAKSSFTERDWELTVNGGGRHLIVGIETLNDQVRKDLGKNFTNDDIEYSFEMSQKYGSIMKFILLFITGYPTETDADYDFREKWFRENVKYQDVINSITVGTTLGITENTPLWRDFDKLGLVKCGPSPEEWINPANGNTLEKRLAWTDRMTKVVADCGYLENKIGDQHYILERLKLKYEPMEQSQTVN